jgi:hypothetical protein
MYMRTLKEPRDANDMRRTQSDVNDLGSRFELLLLDEEACRRRKFVPKDMEYIQSLWSLQLLINVLCAPMSIVFA